MGFLGVNPEAASVVTQEADSPAGHFTWYLLEPGDVTSRLPIVTQNEEDTEKAYTNAKKDTADARKALDDLYQKNDIASIITAVSDLQLALSNLEDVSDQTLTKLTPNMPTSTAFDTLWNTMTPAIQAAQTALAALQTALEGVDSADKLSSASLNDLDTAIQSFEAAVNLSLIHI